MKSVTWRSIMKIVGTGVILHLLFHPATEALAQSESIVPDDRFTELRNEIMAGVEEGAAPSFAVAVAKDGQVIWSEAFGWANRAKQVPATTSTIYAIGSLSKSITATGLSLLVDRGSIKLNDPVYPYLGDAAPMDHLDAANQLRVKHVVTMTGGIPHLWIQPAATDNELPNLSTSALLARYGSSMFPVGTLFNYSNLSFAYPELLIQGVTGQDFSDFMKSELFAPLGMNDSAVELDPEQRARLARGYDENGVALEGEVVFHPRGGGGLYTSIHDLIRYAQFHLQELPDSKAAILRPETLEASQRADDPTMPNYLRYSHGWGRFEMGEQVVLISDGRIAGANSMLVLLPRARTAIACVVNASGGQSMFRALQIADILEPGFMGQAMEFIGQMEAAESPEQVFTVTPTLAGTWRGSVQVDRNELPLTMTCGPGDSITVALGDADPVGVAYPRFIDRPDTVVNGVKFPFRILTGSLDGAIVNDHTKGHDHSISLILRYHEGRFVGEASAIGEGFKLPFFVELDKAVDGH